MPMKWIWECHLQDKQVKSLPKDFAVICLLLLLGASLSISLLIGSSVCSTCSNFLESLGVVSAVTFVGNLDMLCKSFVGKYCQRK
jgi:hypothetical protein